MNELKHCPCGKTPTDLCVESSNGYKWAYVSGQCCNEWEIEFRTNYHDIGTPECLDLAERAWNEAPRGNNEKLYNLTTLLNSGQYEASKRYLKEILSTEATKLKSNCKS